MITRRIDAQDHIIQVVSTGEATRDDIDAHYDALRALIATMRAAGHPIRVLSDQTEAVRLSDDLNDHIKDQIARSYQPGDRLALLMAGTEDKLFVRDVLGVDDYAVFESRLAAEMWLVEREIKPPS